MGCVRILVDQYDKKNSSSYIPKEELSFRGNTTSTTSEDCCFYLMLILLLNFIIIDSSRNYATIYYIAKIWLIFILRTMSLKTSNKSGKNFAVLVFLLFYLLYSSLPLSCHMGWDVAKLELIHERRNFRISSHMMSTSTHYNPHLTPVSHILRFEVKPIKSLFWAVCLVLLLHS